MAATDNLGPQWFHGTNADLKPGDLVEPSFAGRNEGDRVTKNTAYFTGDRYAARYYAKQAHSNQRSQGTPRVYEVEPTGPHDYDPDSENSMLSDHDPHASRHPLKVKGLVEQREAADYDVPWHSPDRDPFDVWMGKITTHPEGNRDQYGNLKKGAK